MIAYLAFPVPAAVAGFATTTSGLVAGLDVIALVAPADGFFRVSPAWTVPQWTVHTAP